MTPDKNNLLSNINNNIDNTHNSNSEIDENDFDESLIITQQSPPSNIKYNPINYLNEWNIYN